jgi:hypothetical protein
MLVGFVSVVRDYLMALRTDFSSRHGRPSRVVYRLANDTLGSAIKDLYFEKLQ